ncbi:MAG: glycosyltransferase family 2 protein [Ignavibacteriaceae bacterium]|nr:glycosyltransferase family 2 protein [Ignavibacteriaceae bacterium]
MIKLSSIIIARDEETNIRRCIESQLGCIDEIVVLVDSRTIDKTFEIATSFKKVKCEQIKWMGYSGTKQYAAALTSNDWIFWIDADEVITTGLSDELNDFKNSNPAFEAYSVPRIANFLGKWIKHSGWYPGRITRLFNKNIVNFSAKDVHEGLITTGSVGRFNNDLQHYTDPNIKHYFEKFNYYTTLAAEELYKKGKNFNITDIIIRPLSIFIKMYILKMGFLDGIQGFILALFSSAYVFVKYCKLWELKNNIDTKE